MSSIRLQILEANYWEHFKFQKDLAGFYPINHPKRIMVYTVMRVLLEEINHLKNVTQEKNRTST